MPCIGVAALIVMVAVGQGANEAVRRQIESLGTNLLAIVPGATNTGGIRAGSGSAFTITVANAQAIRREDPAVGGISYLIRQAGQVQFGNQNWSTTIQSVSPNYPPITNWEIASGRAITADDDAKAALVVLPGQTVAAQLFGTETNPIGALVQVKACRRRVVTTAWPRLERLAPRGIDWRSISPVRWSTNCWSRRVRRTAADAHYENV
jgi:ABC-type antimicrobial peptide transport system permease subunit